MDEQDFSDKSLLTIYLSVSHFDTTTTLRGKKNIYMETDKLEENVAEIPGGRLHIFIMCRLVNYL